MTARTDIERVMDAFLAEGPEIVADRAVLEALMAVDRTPQRRGLLAPWRLHSMAPYLRLATAALVAVVAIGGALFLFNPGIGPGGGPSPTPTALPSPSPAASPGASAPVASLGPSSWATYTSTQYGIKIGYPPGWSITPARRAWSFAADAKTWLSPGEDAFLSPGETVRAAVWSVPLAKGQLIESWADVERWVVDYCLRTGNTGCDTIHQRVVPLCIEPRDCHPALLVPFAEDVQAFGSGGVLSQGTMVVVTIGRGESDPNVAPYGGATRLLEAFLSTLTVVPADSTYPDAANAAASFKAASPAP